MKKKLVALIFTAFLVLSGFSEVGYSQTSDSSSILEKVRKNYSLDKTLKTDFTLTIFWSVREKEEKKLGSITLAPQDRFRVVAGNETFVSDGITYWNYSTKANQVVIKPLASVDLSMLPSRVFTDYIGATRIFTLKEQKNGIALLEWKSDSVKTPYSQIQVWVTMKTSLISKLSMIDRKKNIFTYLFSKTVTGGALSKETFNFAIPKGTRVIDMRT